jgi:mannonate dehydratase
VIRTGSLAKAGYITEQEREYLNEIYEYNPLLFDYVVKRTMRAPGANQRLRSSIFEENPAFSR